MLAVAVLAAGKGTRMKSALPKVLQPLAGATLVERVLASARNLNPDRKVLIVGHQAERVEQQLSQVGGLEFVLQQPQNGTGHAVQQLLPCLQGFEGELLVLNGDVPLLRAETIDELVQTHRTSGADVTLLTARLNDPTGYGRVFTDADGRVSAIVEHRDCNDEQRANNLTNAGIYCFNWQKLAAMLPKLSTDNDQGELYLTDTVAMLDTARHVEVADADEVNGINDRKQLAQCEAVLQERLRDHWMGEGVTFVDPSSCTLSEHCSIGRSNLHIDSQEVTKIFRRHINPLHVVTALQQSYGLFCLKGPVPQQTATDGQSAITNFERSDQIGYNVVVIARIESDVGTPGVSHRSDHIQRLIAIKRGNLDCHDCGDFCETPPEGVRQHSTSHRRLQIKTEQRNDAGHLTAVFQQFLFGGLRQCRQTDQTGVITQIMK